MKLIRDDYELKTSQRQHKLRRYQDIQAIASNVAKEGYEAVMKASPKTKTREISWGMLEGDRINKFGVLKSSKVKEMMQMHSKNKRNYGTY